MNIGVCQHCGEAYEWDDEDPEICFDCIDTTPNYTEWTDD